jgi:alanyl-tRNA synthetase
MVFYLQRSKRLAGRDALTLGAEQVAYLQQKSVLATDDSFKYSWDMTLDTKVEAIYTNEKGFDYASAGENVDTVGIVLSASSFYAEAGGQVADTGTLTLSLASGEEISLEVLDVQSYGGYILHTCSLIAYDEPNDKESLVPAASLSLGQQVRVRVDYSRRRRVAPNHTMTHVLNYALRKAIPENSIEQKGSLVSEEKLRFDFSLNRGMSLEELQKVEETVNQVIKNELSVSSEIVSLKEAMAISGVRAVFGEVGPL